MRFLSIRTSFIIIFIGSLVNSDLLAQHSSNPCEGPYEVIALTNRAGISESPCAIPFRKAFLEGGYQYQQLSRANLLLQNFPQEEFRFGLPGLNEIFFHLPSYNTQSSLSRLSSFSVLSSFRGSTSAGVGLKHQFMPIPHMVASIEGVIYPSGGGRAFGNRDTNTEATAICLYDLSSNLSTTLVLKVESLSPPKIEPVGRYTNVTSGGVLTYSITKSFVIFGQLYGVTKAAPQGAGALNTVFGFFYLLNSKVAIDMEYFRQLTNNWNQFQNSFAVGLSIEL